MFPLPLTVTVFPSRRLLWGLLALHGLALGATWLAQLPLSIKIALSLLLTASLLWHGHQRGAPIRLRCGKDGQLSRHADDEWHPVSLAAPPVLLPSLTILRLSNQDQKGKYPLLILPDSLSKEDFRRLRVWLRWMRPGKP